MKIDISLIIPVYNVENYLQRCLDSVFNQKFSGCLEVIAVEDCSTDNSYEILKKYKLKENRLKIIKHLKNLRLAGARSSGMKAANGKYLMHLDSDDLLLPNSIEKVWECCKRTDADVIVFDYLIENERGVVTKSDRFRKEFVTQNKLEIQKFFFGGSWNKIVKTSFVKNLIYSRSDYPKSTEDLIYCTEILLRSKTICLAPITLYKYFIHSNSITQTSSPINYINNQKVIASNLKKILNFYSPEINFKNQLLNYFSKFIILSIAKIQFYNPNQLSKIDKPLNQLFDLNLMDRNLISTIRSSLNNRYYSLYQVSKKFDLKLALGILKRSFITKK